MKNLIYKSRSLSLLYFKHFNLHSKFYSPDHKDENNIVTVVIPAIDKDVHTLPYVINSVLLNLKHKISNILVISPKECSKISQAIREFPKTKLIFDHSVSPVNKNRVKNYIPKGIDRSGWIMQQLIKLNVSKFIKTQKYLTLDADTLLARPQTYIENDCDLLLFSDELHLPYRDHINKSLGFYPKHKVSFVSHSMIFDVSSVQSMLEDIEKHSKKQWYNALIDNLDENEISSMSEYEMYASYRLRTSNSTNVGYWFNMELPRSRISDDSKSNFCLYKDMRSISYHSYKI